MLCEKDNTCQWDGGGCQEPIKMWPVIFIMLLTNINIYITFLCFSSSTIIKQPLKSIDILNFCFVSGILFVICSFCDIYGDSQSETQVSQCLRFNRLFCSLQVSGIMLNTKKQKLAFFRLAAVYSNMEIFSCGLHD